MPEAERSAIRSQIYTVPFGVDLSDATADLILQKCGQDPLNISTTTLLLPNNRAIKAMTEAFVRKAKPGLLLPRMAAVGDLALDEALGSLLDPLTGDAGVLPAISPAARTILLAQLVAKHRPSGQSISPTEALRLACHLAAMIDELEIEEIDFARFADIAIETDLQNHWQASYAQLLQILPEYRRALVHRAMLGPSERRNILLDRLSARLRQHPPTELFVAAGITTSAKAVARVLKNIALLPQGMMILPGVDLDMPDPLWEALGPHEKSDDEIRPRRSHEAHPQFHLKLLLERMGVRREEIVPISAITQAELRRSVTISDIFCLPEETALWSSLLPRRKKLSELAVLEASDSAEEARAIAIRVRQTLETPALRIALITPDREVAVRVAAQLRRWNISVDDSAGVPLLQTPPGTLILALAEGFASRFTPVALLAIAKHPLVYAGDRRLGWLDMTRKLDLELRGPSKGVGLRAITRLLADAKTPDPKLASWWEDFRSILARLEDCKAKPLADVMAVMQELLGILTDHAIWKGTSGRQLAALWEEFTACDLSAIGRVERAALPAIISEMFGHAVYRPPYGGHPRVAIYGLLEARMQQADIVICAGLNEGTWPQLSKPDPWLAPAIRRHLGLATMDRNIGLSAHDLATALSAKQILLTRAKRDRGGPTVASRFLLRIKALLGNQLVTEHEAAMLALRIDQPEHPQDFAKRPEPSPSPDQRKVDLSITDFDQLKSDPYSFYAKKILGLRVLDKVDADPSYAWRGTLVHDILEKWFKEDHCAPGALIERADALLSDDSLDPVLRALWQPRMAEGLRWIAAETRRLQDEDRRKLLVAERSGSMELSGIKIKGRADRIDRLADGSLAIIDYKTGGAPKARQATAGFAMQLGLVGLMAEQGCIEDVSGIAARFEYWSLAKDKGGFGNVSQPTAKKIDDKNIQSADFVAFIKAQAEDALGKWINGEAAFVAKLHPEYANYEDYDQLMRLQEWNGRQPIVDGEIA